MSSLAEEFRKKAAWGISVNVDLCNCYPEFIRSTEKISQYVKELCEIIKVTRFGDCTVVNFGGDERIAGYPMTQLIETSIVSGHFANKTNTAYLDVFSCNFFEADVVVKFSQQFFEAESGKMQSNFRI